MLKKCSTCGVSKDETEFRKGHNQCKRCSYEKHKEYYNKPEMKAHIKEYKKEYYNKPEIKEHLKEYNKKYSKTPHGKENMLKHSTKRKRQLGFNKLIDHVSDYIEYNGKLDKVCWHHINDIDVVPIPKTLHNLFKGKRDKHRILLEPYVRLLYPKASKKWVFSKVTLSSWIK